MACSSLSRTRLPLLPLPPSHIPSALVNGTEHHEVHAIWLQEQATRPFLREGPHLAAVSLTSEAPRSPWLRQSQRPKTELNGVELLDMGHT